MAATIRDISKRTGLALATVSKYLNGGNVLPENREKLERAVQELHYEVNEVARGLATNKTRTIGVLIHSFDNVFAGKLISVMEDVLRQHNYGTIICDCRGDKKIEEEEIQFLLGKRVDGIITIPTAGNAGYLKKALERDIPVVLIDRAFAEESISSVLVDNTEAAKSATEVLLGHGHRRIAIICGTDQEFTARERLRGYYKALENGNVDIDLALVKRGSLTVEFGYSAMKEIISMKDRPTAVFLSNYEITLGSIIAVNELGIQFPEEISLIGFDNFMLSEIVKPKLWMVVQPMEKIATSAAELMLQQLEEEREPKHLVLKTSIVKGKSIKKTG